MIKEFTERPTDAYYDSPVVILFFSKDSPTKVLDGAAALENMLLATAAIDLGACWIHRSSFSSLQKRKTIPKRDRYWRRV